ncbi:MAG: SprB repeat-containing protein [Flavobacteriales bacterium]|nr:SprB repeat-containing protein [Flavobacteriales bacterium]
MWGSNATFLDGTFTSSINTISGLCGGGFAPIYYDATVTDANGSSGSASISLYDPMAVSIQTGISSNISCNGFCDGAVSVIGSGGTGNYTYLWSNGQTSSIATSLCSGPIDVTVTDGNGCWTSLSTTLLDASPIIISPIYNPISCYGYCDAYYEYL